MAVSELEKNQDKKISTTKEISKIIIVVAAI